MRIFVPLLPASFRAHLSVEETAHLIASIETITGCDILDIGNSVVMVVREKDYDTNEEYYSFKIDSMSATAHTAKTLEEAAKRIAALVTLEA